jgi:hypothetical protein
VGPVGFDAFLLLNSVSKFEGMHTLVGFEPQIEYGHGGFESSPRLICSVHEIRVNLNSEATSPKHEINL